MKDRIRLIRNKAKMTQEEFASFLGTTGKSISSYETGNKKPSKAVMAAMCRAFNVREEWLRDGTGEMETNMAQKEQIKSAIDRILCDESETIKQRMLAVLIELDEVELKALESFALKLVGMTIQKPVPESPPEPPKSTPSPKKTTDIDIEAELEAYRKELIAQQKGREESSVSESIKENA